MFCQVSLKCFVEAIKNFYVVGLDVRTFSNYSGSGHSNVNSSYRLCRKMVLKEITTYQAVGSNTSTLLSLSLCYHRNPNINTEII